MIRVFAIVLALSGIAAAKDSRPANTPRSMATGSKIVGPSEPKYEVDHGAKRPQKKPEIAAERPQSI